MPAMMVWPVSSSVWTWKVGSSSESQPSALPSLSWSTLVLGSMATEITGSGNSMRSSTIGWAGIAERVTGGGVLEPDRGDDVAGEHRVLVFPVVGVHLEETADALLLVLGGVEHRAAGRELARVHAEVGELADVRVAHDLERQRGERLGIVGACARARAPASRRCP